MTVPTSTRSSTRAQNGARTLRTGQRRAAWTGWHSGPTVCVVTERADATHEGDGEIAPSYANLYLMQRWNEREPVVRLDEGDSLGFSFTLDEAELLTQVLGTLVDQGRCVLAGHSWNGVPSK